MKKALKDQKPSRSPRISHPDKNVDHNQWKKNTQHLITNNLKPVEPNWIKPDKSIFIYDVPPQIMNHYEQELITIIKEENPKKFQIGQLYKIINKTTYGQTYTIKLILENQIEAEYIIKNGIHMYALFLHPEHIERKNHIFIRQCFKCFSYDHVANSCHDIQHCNACGGTHHFNLCKQKDQPKCIRCGGNHFAN